MKKYEVEVNGETFIVSLKEISNEEAAQKLAAAPTPAPSAPVEEKKPEKDLFGDWDIRRETTVRETTSSTEADSPFAQSNFVEAPVEPKQTEMMD